MEKLVNELEKLSEELSEQTIQSYFFCYDLTLPEGPRKLFEFLQKRYARSDGHVHVSHRISAPLLPVYMFRRPRYRI